MPVPPRALTLVCLLSAGALPARAERHLWTVPGTRGIAYTGIQWDARTGSIIATLGHRVVRLDPLSGARAVLAEVRWTSEEHRGESRADGPLLDGPVLTPEGAVEVLVQDPNDHRLLRLEPGGGIRTLAGQAGGAWIYRGDAEDATQAAFTGFGLALGPDGARYLADYNNGRVLRVDPGGGSASGPGQSPCGLRAIAGNGGHGWPDFPSNLEKSARYAAARRTPLAVPIKPWGIAVTRAGEVVFAADGRVFTLVPGPEDPGGRRWELAHLAGAGGWRTGAEADHPDARAAALGMTDHLAEGEGRIYVGTTDSRIWELTPREAGGVRSWRCSMIAGGQDEGPVAADAVPARQALLDQDVHGHSQLTALAAVPGGGLLVATASAGIRFIGPPPEAPGHGSDALLAERVREYRRLKGQGDADGARVILEALVRQRDDPAKALEAPFRGLCSDGELHPALPGVLHRHLGTFLTDPRVFRFRAALAIHATGDGDLHPAPVPATFRSAPDSPVENAGLIHPARTQWGSSPGLATPPWEKAWGGVRRPPHPSKLEVTDCDLKFSHSSWLSWNMKSAGNRSRFRLVAWISALVGTP